MAVWSVVKIGSLASGFRMDPEYYQPRYLKDSALIDGLSCKTIVAMAFVTDGIHGSPDEVEEGGVRYLSAKCVKDNDFALGAALHISDAQHATNPRTALRAEDVLITTVGTIGNAAVVQNETVPANSDRHLGIIRLKTNAEVDSYYLATFLNSEYGRFQSLREATGNVQLNLFIEKIRVLRIPLLKCADRVSKDTRRAYERRRDAAKAMAQAETLLVSSLGLDHIDLSPSRSYSRPFQDLMTGRRFGAEYYMPCKQRALDALAAMPHSTLHDHAPNIRDLWEPASTGKGAMVRNFDLSDALEPFLDDTKEPMAAAEVGSTKKQFKAGDVVVSRLRSYLREIAVVRTGNGVACVGSSEFIVLRPAGKGLSAETILVYLRCPLVQTILKWSQDGSNHPRFDEDDLMVLPVPDKLREVSPKIERHVQAAIACRQEAARLLANAKTIVQKAILGETGS
jgi:type I restriction enzyme S subunit